MEIFVPRENICGPILPQLILERPVSLGAKIDCQLPEIACAEPNSGYVNNLNKHFQEKNPPLPPTAAETPKVSPGPEAIPPAAGGVSGFSHDFASAWALYPKKEAQGFARMAWHKLQRAGQLPPLPDILTAIQHFSASESWSREGGRFVPQMGNWLRGQRWLDPLPLAEEEEKLRRQDVHSKLQKQEKRLHEQQNAEKLRLKPLFAAFAAKFTGPFNDAMAFGIWMYLRSRNFAPLASDVPPNNSLGIIDFLDAFKRQYERAPCRSTRQISQPGRHDADSDEARPCDDILRHGFALCRFVSGTVQSRQAV